MWPAVCKINNIIMYQIFVKDRCTSNGKTYKIDISNNITMMEFKEKIFEKIPIPIKHQKFIHGRKYLKNDKLLLEQINFNNYNWADIDLTFRWNTTNP